MPCFFLLLSIGSIQMHKVAFILKLNVANLISWYDKSILYTSNYKPYKKGLHVAHVDFVILSKYT